MTERPRPPTSCRASGRRRPSKSTTGTRRARPPGALPLELAGAPMRLSFMDPAGAWLLREPVDGGMSIEPGDGRRRVRAGFAFSGEQHFYGLGQGGGRLDRLGTVRHLWDMQPGHGPGSALGVALVGFH